MHELNPFHGLWISLLSKLLSITRNLVKEGGRGIKVGASKSKSARGLRDEQDIIVDDSQDWQPPPDFVRDNFGDARALVVQSIYNARRAPAFRITASYYWLRAGVASRCCRSSVRQQQWCDTMSWESLNLSSHRTLPSDNYHREFRDNTLFQRGGEGDLQLEDEVLLCNLTLMKYIYEYNILFIIFLYLITTRVAQDSRWDNIS